MNHPVIIGGATLYNMDCMEYMRTLPDLAFDLAIVDPPYGIKVSSHRKNNRTKIAVSTDYHNALWKQSAPTAEYFDELRRVSRHQIVWGGNHLAAAIGRSSPCWIVWDKDNGISSYADAELAYTSFPTAVRIFKYMWNGMHQGSFGGNVKLNEKRIHPTQKPVALYEWLLLNYAQAGFKIFDSHSGSGSQAIACNRLGYEITACEIDPKYFNDSLVRIEDEHAQQRMFA